MAVTFEFVAEPRNEFRTSATRRYRREGKLPAIVYGGGEVPRPVLLDHDVVLQQLQNEAFFSHVLTVKTGNHTEKVILRDLQRHPYKPKLLHMDLQRVSETEKLHVHVPLHFIGEDAAPGVKQGGGIVSHQLTEVEVSCLPRHLPEYLEVDMTQMEVGDTIHLSDLKVPEGVELAELARGPEHDSPVASIVVPRAAVEEEAGAEAEAAAAAEEQPPEEEEGESPGS